MISEFFARNLHKTVDFLSKVGITSDEVSVTLSSKEYLSLTYQSLKEYRKVYNFLLCKVSKLHIEEVVFCDCCSARCNFLRNFCLISHINKTVKVHWNRSKKDEFLLYIEGKIKKDCSILLEVIAINPWFWEAYSDLAEIITPELVSSTDIVGGLSEFFFMHLFCTKMIRKSTESFAGSRERDKKVKVSGKDVVVNMKYPNLAGAVLYHEKDFDGCIRIFDEITRNTLYYDLDYVDLYSNALYVRKDDRVIVLAENALIMNRYRAETMCCIANWYSMRKEHEKAIEYFKLSMKLRPNSSIVHTLIGHEHLEMKNMEKAISSYNTALKMCPADYRAWYGVGQAYATMMMHEYALFFVKKALEFKDSDPVVWMTLGQCYISLSKINEAVSCFKNAVDLGDPDGYLYIGDAYKDAKMYAEAVMYYEKYVECCKDDTKKICSFLEEYFRKICDEKRSVYYAKLTRG